MQAITLLQPWAWAIAHAGKRIENRTWKPPAKLVGQRIAIHAGKRVDHSALPFLDELGLFQNSKLPTLVVGAVEAVATLRGWVAGVADDHPQRVWAQGPFCWVFDDVVALPHPVPCSGSQRIWTLPIHVDELVVQQLEKFAT